MADKSGYQFPILATDGTIALNYSLVANTVPNSSNSGVLFSWGLNTLGGIGDGTTVDKSSPIQIGSLTTWNQLAVGGRFQAAVKTDGTLWTWGYNKYGELGNGNTIYYSSPIQVGSLTTWSSVSCGYGHTSAVKTDGTLWICGYNGDGQLGNNADPTINYSSPVQIGALTNWSKVSNGYDYTAAVKTDGTLWSWGRNASGQLGYADNTVKYSSPVQVGSLTTWSKISCGYKSSAAIKTDGTLWTWGLNNKGQLGNGTTTNYSSPIQIGSSTNWNQVAAGINHLLAIKTDGTLWTCGYNNYGQLGNGTVNVYYSSPIQIGSLTTWSKVTAGNWISAAIKTDGTMWTWGWNGNGYLGNGTTTNYSSPIQVGALTNWSSLSVNYGSSQNFSATANYYTVSTSTKVDLADAMVSKDQFLNAGLWSWGYGNYGILGNGQYTANYSSPIQIGSLTNWRQISSIGGNLTQQVAGIKTDGSLWTWGNNNYGQLGLGTVSSINWTPTQVGALTNWKQASSAFGYIAAIKTDGTLWSCGYNPYGNLGVAPAGSSIRYSSPVQVGSLTNWKQVACGEGFQTVAVKTDGTLWSCGYNKYGELGNGTTIHYSSPIQVGSLTNWKQVAAGYATFSIKTDGTLWGWGRNNNGQLGNGNIISYSSPIQIGSLTNWKQVSTYRNSTTAIKTDGTLWTWGYNGYGQLGNGNIISYSSPIQIGSLTNWKQVSCGYAIAAIKTDGTLWAWGYNNSGGLGNGTTIKYSSPIQIGSLTNWKQVSCGYATTIAIQSPDNYFTQYTNPPSTPTVSAVGMGTSITFTITPPATDTVSFYTLTNVTTGLSYQFGWNGAGVPVSYTISGLSANTTYSFQLSATNNYGTSPVNSFTASDAASQQAYTTAGTYTWVAPAGVTSVSVLGVGAGGSGALGQGGLGGGGGGGGGGLGYINNYTVVPGNSYTVIVGAGGTVGNGLAPAGNKGGDSSFNSSLIAYGGNGGTASTGSGGTGGSGGSYTGFTAGGTGGTGGSSGSTYGGGGGGAAGYSGNGGNSGFGNATAGAGGGGGGGNGQNWGNTTGGNSGGGVGILGQGSNGAAGLAYPSSPMYGGGGSGGADGQGSLTAYAGFTGGAYGGGGGAGSGGYNATAGAGAVGAIRIMWGGGRSYPSNAGDL